MSITKINPRNGIIILFVVVVAAFRVLINMNGKLHPLTNFSPIGAMALFSGSYFKDRKQAFALPLLTLLVSDIILSLTAYKEYSHGILYSGWYWVYGAFALMVLAGKLMLKKVTIKSVLMASIGITLIHWIVSDLGVWLHGSAYSKDIFGFWACLAAAIPFEKNFLFGSLLYSALMFGTFEWLQARIYSLKPE